MVRVLRFIFADFGIKVLAAVLAVLLWAWAVLDRSYVTDVAVPVTLHRIETKKVISDFETRAAIVKLEGKGRDLVGLRLRQPKFKLTIPEGRAGVHRLKLDVGDLDVPKNLTIASVIPEEVELRLNEVGRRRVTVEVPTRGRARKNLTVTDIRPVGPVRLVGPEDDVDLFATVHTESLDLGSLRQTDSVLLAVIPPDEDGFSTEPESVLVAFTVEAEEARIFLGVPVRASAPAEAQVSLEPTEAQIAVAGPASRLDALEPGDILARVNAADLEPGQHRVAAEIELPEGFRLIRCEPSHFAVTVQ